MLLHVTQLILVVIIVVGVFALQIFSETNGLFSMAAAAQKRGKIPDGPIYQPVFTGVEGLDNLLNLLVQFFWPAVDGKHIDTALVGALLGAQGTAAFALITLEGLRHGNAGRIVSFTTIVGMLIQLLGLGIVGPAYLLINLITVPPSAGATAQSVAVPENYLRAFPASLIIGFIIPSVLMSLPSPGILTTNQKILAILIWQLFPIWSAIALQVVARSSSSSKGSTPQPTAKSLEAFRGVYRFALYVSAGGHIAVLGLSATAYFRPDLIGESVAGYLHPAYLYLPQNPFSKTTQVSSIAEGAFWFLQWDLVNTVLSFYIWALCVKSLTVRNTSAISLLSDIILRPILLGPASAALLMVWDRDELLLSNEVKSITKKKL